jgi:transglutaminase-like putative cysteine protease
MSARGWPLALVLAAAAVVALAPYSGAASTAGAALATFAGGLAGAALGRSRVRGWVVPALAFAGAGALLLLGEALSHSTLLARGAGPELTALVLDAWRIGAVGVAVGLAAGFLALRLPGGRAIPPALLVLATAALLGAHRGGAINRPLALSDLAYLRGYHPAFLLGLGGALVGWAATLALYRPRRARAGVVHWLLLAAPAVLLLVAFPAIGVFRFAEEDPLSLAGDPNADHGFPVAGGLEQAAQRQAGDGDGPLNLSRRAGGTGGGAPEPAPFLDEYSRDGSEVPVAVVLLHDDVDRDAQVLYFRQTAFSVWNGRRLVRSFDGDVDPDLFHGYPVGGVTLHPAPPGSALRDEVPTTVALMRDHFQPPVLADGVRLEPAPNTDPSLFRRTYSSVSAVLAAPPLALVGRTAGDPAWSPAVRETYLEVPDDPRYRALAEEILAGVRPEYRDDPWARALSIGLWLEQNTQYSLRSQHASAADPTGSFLFGSRIGYCVHLAHATAYLARILGVPARVAAGYAYVEDNRGGGSALLLRAGDAHAWAEVYLAGVGWVPVDPSPPSLDPAVPAPDVDLQRLLGELARAEQPGITRGVDRWRPPALRTVLLAAVLLLGVWVVAGWLLKAWRAAAPWLGDHDDAVRLAYRASLDRLADAGLYRERGETREAFAARSAAVAPSFGELTWLHLAGRFGRHPPDTRRGRALARTVARELRGRLGARRWLGVLAPWRWRRSR